MPASAYRVIGLMSGTSYDGIDVAVADLAFDGDTIVLSPLGALEHAHQPEVRDLIASVLPPARVTLEDVCRLDTLLGQAFADAAARGIAELAGGRADLIVSHGQTVFHWIEAGRALGTLQLGQPAWIADRTGTPVISDLRARDITRGGQGAPLVSVLDVLLLPPGDAPRAALNLGGIANLTLIRPLGGSSPTRASPVCAHPYGHGSVLAYDLGPANALIDLACRRYFNEPYDADGRHAAAGRLHGELLAALLDEPYFDRPAPKSTGKELFHTGYLDARLALLPDEPPAADVVATVTELTARIVARECARHGIRELVASGGGVRNPWLMRRIADLAGPAVHVGLIDDAGLPADSKEAYAFALLGFLTLHGVPATIPACTGADRPVFLGSLTPGNEPLHVPPRSCAVPTRLRIEAG
ncbi:anhydro-N-acetylmuramic acid kinase [Actinopolymorpha alba]|uniref:anhydro-N-acetylmuramic acid kinase n=1 Tax=Actinopolymorpha alba TaxID=533267 RepID=UPI00039BD6AC|nr:anhydro-N-acetylmuramic acid kinase [Actinopolymorpha alba]